MIADIGVNNHGTIVLFTGLTEAGQQWLDKNIDPDAMTSCGSVACEHRYASDIAQGAINDGLEVR